MNNNFILVCSTAENIHGKKISSYDIAISRLKKSAWPIYKRTPNKGVINEGDRCLIYLAGNASHSQSFIATAVVKSIIPWSGPVLFDDDLLTDIPISTIQLQEVIISKPSSIKQYLSKLNFIKITSAGWGRSLQGGCRKISDLDYDIISNKIKIKGSD